MSASSHRLASLLAERIAEILPPPLTVRASGDALKLYADGIAVGGATAASILEDGDDAEQVRTAAWAVLSTIQDDVMEHLTEPWPVGAGGQGALPEARIDASHLHLWFGEREEAAVVRLRPISLAEVLGRRA